MSQIVCGLNFEQYQDDSIFPIESEKSYLTALICLFHLTGDPRGRGNLSLPCMLLVTWKLSVLSLCVENRKTHDSEFAEELFDAVLSNLNNHKQVFRVHQNDKLNNLKRAELEKVGGSQADKGSTRGSGTAPGTPAGSRKRAAAKAAGGGPDQHVLEQFELDQDADGKRRSAFNLQEATTHKSALDLARLSRPGLS